MAEQGLVLAGERPILWEERHAEFYFDVGGDELWGTQVKEMFGPMRQPLCYGVAVPLLE